MWTRSPLPAANAVRKPGSGAGTPVKKIKNPAEAAGFFVAVYKAGIVDKFPENKVNCTYQHGKGTSVVFAAAFFRLLSVIFMIFPSLIRIILSP